VNLKCSYTFLLVGVLWNILGKKQIDIHKLIIINPNKASGPDIISHKMLKICPEKIAAPLQIILNKSILQCKYPSSW
jgi:hypothetical protein